MSLPTEDKARKALPIWSYTMEYFPDAYLAEVGVAVAGNEQHNPGESLHWARGKSKDQMNTAFRHMWDHGRGVIKDTDGQYHLAKAIWRLKAELQLTIEMERLNPLVEVPPGTGGARCVVCFAPATKFDRQLTPGYQSFCDEHFDDSRRKS